MSNTYNAEVVTYFKLNERNTKQVQYSEGKICSCYAIKMTTREIKLINAAGY